MKVPSKSPWSAVSAALLFASGVLAYTPPPAFQSGCSNVKTGTQLREQSNFMSNGRCQQNCLGSAFAIVQYESCWCSDVAPPSMGNVGDCNQNCPGYPNDKCGNTEKGLYGYIAVGGKPPSSTAGGGAGGSSDSNSQPGFGAGFGGSPTSSSQQQSPPRTVVPTTTNIPATSVIKVTSAQTSVQTSVATVSLTPDASTETSTPSPSILTSAAIVTVSGAVVTSIVTSAAGPSGTAQPDSRLAQQTKSSGVSNGAVAGITIGAVAAVAFILLAFFFFWRRRKQQQMIGDGEQSSMNRSGSVMSKMGLLRTGSATSAPLASSDGPRLPQIITTVPGVGGPESASTNMSENRRNSRPIFVDSRLNPNAIMLHNDQSRTSIATLQDNQDYSRPLEVRNPD